MLYPVQYILFSGEFLSRQFLTLYLQKTKLERDYSPNFFGEEK